MSMTHGKAIRAYPSQPLPPFQATAPETNPWTTNISTAMYKSYFYSDGRTVNGSGRSSRSLHVDPIVYPISHAATNCDTSSNFFYTTTAPPTTPELSIPPRGEDSGDSWPRETAAPPDLLWLAWDRTVDTVIKTQPNISRDVRDSDSQTYPASDANTLSKLQIRAAWDGRAYCWPRAAMRKATPSKTARRNIHENDWYSAGEVQSEGVTVTARTVERKVTVMNW